MTARKSAITENSESDAGITCFDLINILLNSDILFQTLTGFLSKYSETSEERTSTGLKKFVRY